MNPNLYALLPPDKQTEYKQHQKEPVLMPAIMIDESVPVGWAKIKGELFKLPDAQTCTWTDGNYDPGKDLLNLKECGDKEAQTCTTKSIEPIDFDMLKNIVKEFNDYVADSIFFERFRDEHWDLVNSTLASGLYIEELRERMFKEYLHKTTEEAYMRYLIKRILGD